MLPGVATPVLTLMLRHVYMGSIRALRGTHDTSDWASKQIGNQWKVIYGEKNMFLISWCLNSSLWQIEVFRLTLKIDGCTVHYIITIIQSENNEGMENWCQLYLMSGKTLFRDLGVRLLNTCLLYVSLLGLFADEVNYLWSLDFLFAG